MDGISGLAGTWQKFASFLIVARKFNTIVFIYPYYTPWKIDFEINSISNKYFKYFSGFSSFIKFYKNIPS